MVVLLLTVCLMLFVGGCFLMVSCWSLVVGG